ncbi:hypothetical protein B0H16DRAFT_1449915 [Mycena metata]|uniref:Uncharacterized protein n=1 Tax=Mycena metata TaxID=1033252 RepID=A0AAD7NUJ3_9AGAR|nr:hypothetical protein B0H16DRAFT_1449915 [Mycena metata]
MDRPGVKSIIPRGYELTDADMANPVVQALCGMLDHTENQLNRSQRSKLECEIVTGKQMSRLQIKLADTKMRLQAAQKRFDDFEEQTSRALCTAAIEHQKLQRLIAMQKEFSCGICWEVMNSPDVSRVTEVPIANYELETAVEALLKVDIFKRGQAVKRLQDDYKKYFPETVFDHTWRHSSIGNHRYAYRQRGVRFDPRFRQPRLNSPAYTVDSKVFQFFPLLVLVALKLTPIVLPLPPDTSLHTLAYPAPFR